MRFVWHLFSYESDEDTSPENKDHVEGFRVLRLQFAGLIVSWFVVCGRCLDPNHAKVTALWSRRTIIGLRGSVYCRVGLGSRDLKLST